jgi:hypothetical protein
MCEQPGGVPEFEGKRGVRVPIERIPTMFDDNIFLERINEEGGVDASYYDDENDEEGEGEVGARSAPRRELTTSFGTEEKGERPEGEDSVSMPVAVPGTTPSQDIVSPPSSSSYRYSYDMGDLVAMETQAKLEGSGDSELGSEEEQDDGGITTINATNDNNDEYGDAPAPAPAPSSSSSSSYLAALIELEDEYEMSMDKALDAKRAAAVRRSMTINGAQQQQQRRVTRYDPNDYYRPDPMKYGAYRRWQVDNDEENDSRKASKGGKNGAVSSSGGRKNSGGGGTVRKRGGDRNSNNNKKKGGGDTTSFYKAIKNLGSGPKGDGESTGTGVVEPGKGSGMKNVEMPKQPPRSTTRRTRRVVTAQDIDSIFDDDDDDDDDGEGEWTDVADYRRNIDDDEDDVDSVRRGKEESTRRAAELIRAADAADPAVGLSPQQTMRMDPASLNSFFDDDQSLPKSSSVDSDGNSNNYNNKRISMDTLTSEDVPKWLADAEKDAKKALKSKGKKKKRFTEDWRFWAAIIASVGFASAFFTTRGSSNNINIANPITQFQQKQQSSNSNGGRGEPDELVI